MSQYLFGSGILWGTPLTDANSNAIAVPSPVQFGVLQDTSVDISFDTKMLYGQNQFPVAVGRGKGKIDCKAKFGKVNGQTFNSLFFGQTLTAGVLGAVYDTTGHVIPGTPFGVTPTVPESGTWSDDLGVRSSTGIQMTRVASGPATGQYSVSAGVYTFASADTGATVFIDYKYTASSSVAQKSIIANLPMGYAPTFKSDLLIPYQGKKLILSLPKCISSKMAMATKQDDFVIPELDFSAFADDSGNVGYWSLSE